MPGIMPRRAASLAPSLALAFSGFIATGSVALAASPPPIRIGQDSAVAACVTPERLMAFLETRNTRLDARYRDLAKIYQQHGETWRVRWDYAFYQMVIETNYLMFHRGDGRSGDVNPKQYNFAGLGTTGGGVPGDAYPDASTGVLAQIQHLVAYSGERIDLPVGARTRLKQDDIISASASVSRRRAVTFQDLSGRWAVDRAYGRMIESVAERYRAMFCTGREPAAITAADATPAAARPAPQPVPRALPTAAKTASPKVRVAAVEAAPVVAQPVAARQPGPGFTAPKPSPVADAAPPVSGCRLQSASFGGRKAVLISATVAGEQPRS